MKFNYLFKSQNNGHFHTYQAIASNSLLNQEKVTKWLMENPMATRMGADISAFCQTLDKKQIEWEIFNCPCCDQRVMNILPDNLDSFIKLTKRLGFSWTMLEGISGNY